MHDSPPRHHDDDPVDLDDGHDDLAALDFSPPPRSDETILDAFEDYGRQANPGSDGVDYREPTQDSAADDDESVVPTFTVTNPPGTVSVTTFVDGRVRHVQLSPKVNTLSEVSLAEEIMVIARLATQDARAGQFAFMLEGLRLQGHDGPATRDFLQRDLDLPSPEQVARERAALFEQRYAGNHE